MIKMICRRIALLLSVALVSSITFANYDSSVDNLLEGTLIYSGSEANALKAFDGDASTYYAANVDARQWVGLPHMAVGERPCRQHL